MATAKKSITKLASEIDLFDRTNGTSSKTLRPVEEFLSLPLLTILRWCHIFISWVREETLAWGNRPLAVWWLCQRSDIRPSTLREAGRAASWLGSRDGFDYPPLKVQEWVQLTMKRLLYAQREKWKHAVFFLGWLPCYIVFSRCCEGATDAAMTNTSPGSGEAEPERHAVFPAAGDSQSQLFFAGSAGSHSGVSSRSGSISSDAHPGIVISQS